MHTHLYFHTDRESPLISVKNGEKGHGLPAASDLEWKSVRFAGDKKSLKLEHEPESG